MHSKQVVDSWTDIIISLPVSSKLFLFVCLVVCLTSCLHLSLWVSRLSDENGLYML